MIGKIKAERGLTHEELLWGETWATLMLESLDQPYYDPKATEEVEVQEGLSGLLTELKR